MHTECKDKLDKTCSEVSEGVWVCEGRGGHKAGGSVGDESEEQRLCVCMCVCMCTYVCVYMCVCIRMCVYA